MIRTPSQIQIKIPNGFAINLDLKPASSPINI